MFESQIFPHPNTADENGIVCMGGEASVPLLIEAYSCGIFPWPQRGYPLLWFSPNPRGILRLSDLHIPQSLKKWEKKVHGMDVILNERFQEVIEACASAKRPGQSGTWITEDLLQGYVDLAEMGYAYSVAVVNRSDEVIAGLYGVCLDRFVSAESMFFTKTNTSKLALWKWLQFLQEQNYSWIDIQMVTPVSETFGGKYISRSDFLQDLAPLISDLRPPTWAEKSRFLARYK